MTEIGCQPFKEPHGPRSSGCAGIQVSSFPWPYLLILDLFLLAALIVATRLATFLHEVIGHGLFAAAFKGEVSGIRVSLFGGGHAYYHFNRELGLTGSFLVAMGGILINLLSGAAAFRWFYTSQSRSSWALFSALFGMVSLLGALTYACLGFYYGIGDPIAWIKEPLRVEWLFVPALLASPFVSWFAVRSFFLLIQPWFPAKGFSDRLVVLVITLGVSVAAYAALYGVTGQRSTALDTPKLAYERAKEEVRMKKRVDLSRIVREIHPEWSEAELQQWLERVPIAVRPEEIPKGFPLVPVLLLFYAGGAVMALRNAGNDFPDGSPRIPLLSVLLAVCTAGAVLGVLLLKEGWIWNGG